MNTGAADAAKGQPAAPYSLYLSFVRSYPCSIPLAKEHDMTCCFDLTTNCWIPSEDANPSTSVNLDHITILPDGPTPDESTWDAITEEKQAQFYREPNEAQGRPRGMPPAPLTYKRGWTYSKWRSFYLNSQTKPGRHPKQLDAGHIESMEEIACDELFDRLGPEHRRIDHRDWWNDENNQETDEELERDGTTQVTTDIDGHYVTYISSDELSSFSLELMTQLDGWTDADWDRYYADWKVLSDIVASWSKTS